MAKQKVVLKLCMDDPKKRAKAMQCAVGLHACVVSASHEGDKMTLLRKMGYVELVTVTAVEEKEVKVKADVKSITQSWISSHYYDQPVSVITQPPYYYRDFKELSYYDQNSCSVM